MKYEFASAGWVAFLHGRISERFEAMGSDRTTVDWSICEIFSDPPAHLSPDGAPLAWHCSMRNGAFRFGTGIADDVAVTVRADYRALVPVGRYDTRGEAARAAELHAMVAALIDRGAMSVEGALTDRDPRFSDIHDIVARVTA